MPHHRPWDAEPVSPRTNAEWIRDLKAAGTAQAAALEELRAYLVRAARFALRRGPLAQDRPGAIDQVAEDCAQDALLAILAKLDDFRGESRFTTWAYKFAVNIALVAARRERWKHVSLDALLDGPTVRTAFVLADPVSDEPERSARRAEAWQVVEQVIEHELTDRQRQAMKALIVDEVPLDELVRHWGTSRNAVYKLVHDARRRLRAELVARGFEPKDVLALFGAAG